MSQPFKIETVGQYRSQWGEGPVWWNQCLYYVDIEAGSVVRYDPVQEQEKIWEVKPSIGRVGMLAPCQKGGFLIAGDNGIGHLNITNSKVTLLSDPEPDSPDNRFNDGACSPDGDLFAGTISLIKKEGAAALYRYSKQGETSVAYSPVTNSNGIVWSLDGTCVYYIDTPKKEILSFNYDKGVMSNPQRVVDTSNEPTSPDGMTIDAEGKLWVAFCHGACVKRFCPESGIELESIELPCLETTAVSFGGEKLQDLYVTTGIHKDVKEELGGRLLVIRNLGVKGVPAHSYLGQIEGA